MDDTSSASGGDAGFFGTVNDVLGAVNNFGVTAVNLRERYKRAGSSTEYAVPVPQGSQPGRIAAVEQDAPAGFQLSAPVVIVGVAALLLVVVVAYKLSR